MPMIHPLRSRLPVLLALALLSGPMLARAQSGDYPNRPLRLVVPFAPGGSADVFGRFIAQKLQESMGQTVVVDNRPGAGSVIGTDAVAKSPADGYTLLLMSNAQTVNESLIKNRPYNLLRDFAPVAPINASDLVLVARRDLPAPSLVAVLRAAKAKPGGLTYASSGPGTPYHMAGELLKTMAGVSMVHIPYKGSAGARTDLIGGQVDLMFDAVPTMVEQVRAGKVQALATTGRERSQVLPNVPTVAESGVAGYEATIWLGLMVPKATPQPVVARLNAEVGKITANAEVRRAWAQQGTTAMTMGVDAFARYLETDIAKWAKVVKFSGATAE
jgi:tripartite-type tricarboxylate transporter receptor subunit TctC